MSNTKELFDRHSSPFDMGHEDNLMDFEQFEKAISELPSSSIRSEIEIEKIAKIILAEFWSGAILGIGNSSLRNMTQEEYYSLNKEHWDNKAKALFEHLLTFTEEKRDYQNDPSYILAMNCLQSTRYHSDAEFRDDVDNVLSKIWSHHN
jgi:hypothetical protein